MEIKDLIAEGQKLMKSPGKAAFNHDSKFKQRYSLWVNNCETYLEDIKFEKVRINLFRSYALNHRFDEIMGMLLSIEANQPKVAEKKIRKSDATDKVFIVHGHNEAVKEKVARFVEHLKLKPIILHEQADKGRTIIEKFEANSEDVNFAIVLLTADDSGKANKETNFKQRARQNVIFEMGYFIGMLSRSHVFMLLEEGVEKPSDLDGIVYTSLSEDWKSKLFKELTACGYKLDANDLVP